MICSSGANRGTDLFGRECFHFDGRTYRPAGYTNEGHYRGAMVAFSIYNQDNNGVWTLVVKLGGMTASSFGWKLLKAIWTTRNGK